MKVVELVILTYFILSCVKYREIQPCVWRKGEEVTLAACLANLKEFQWGVGDVLAKNE